jgi:hypothetical protein
MAERLDVATDCVALLPTDFSERDATHFGCAGHAAAKPKVPLTPYPWSSVMISRTLGAPLGGTTFGGHQVLESVAFSLITPPNLGGGGGI